RAVYHAIRQAREMVSQNVAEFIEEKIQQKADE
ncbi:phosphate acyltransferase, partial [Staphylococcus aureus]|nr:phosphate acyltransferase [Staphylococcus aureus]